MLFIFFFTDEEELLNNIHSKLYKVLNSRDTSLTAARTFGVRFGSLLIHYIYFIFSLILIWLETDIEFSSFGANIVLIKMIDF